MKKNSLPGSSFIISLLGLWLIFSPATFSFQEKALIYSDWICGFLLFFLGIWGRKEGRVKVMWWMGLIGSWLQIAPLAFVTKDAASYLNDTLVGLLVIVFSLLLKRDEPGYIPPGYTYNPSSWAQRLPVAFLVFLCWMISRYLAAFEFGFIDHVWDPFFAKGTQKVLTSTISKDFPVPDAGLGALAYTFEFLATCQGSQDRWRKDPWLVLIFGLLVIPVGFTSVCLVILQPLVVGAWCTLCLTTAVCMLLAIVFALDEVIASLRLLKTSKKRPFLSLLIHGEECEGARREEGAVTLEDSFWTILKKGFEGVSFPWNFLLSSGLGIFLMMIPWLFQEKGIMVDLDPITGAFMTAFSVLCFAKRARALRWINVLIAGCLLFAALFSMKELSLLMMGSHVGIALLMVFLNLKIGKRGI